MEMAAAVECGACGQLFEGWWQDPTAETLDEVDEPPVREQECPACGSKQVETWPGWAFRMEAG